MNDINIMDRILIFKTNVRLIRDLRSVATALNKIPEIQRWNLDRQDVDRVLRIESQILSATDIVMILKEAGYHCEELPD